MTLPLSRPSEPTAPILAPDEPFPVVIRHPEGRSPFVLVCDHAGRRVPRSLARLGLDEPEFDRHIAWDIGIAAVSRQIAEALDSVLIEQVYSRLVIDCNRPPHVPGSIPAVSEATPIPGNGTVSESERIARRVAIFDPYHDAIRTILEARAASGRETVLIAMHSFTPTYLGESRPWHIGTLYGRDGRLAQTLGAALTAEDRFVVGDNKPYDVGDESDHTIPVHGERRGLLHVGIEIRQDLITEPDGQREWADILIRLFPQALEAYRR